MTDSEVETFVEELSGVDPSYKSDIELIERTYNCSIYCDTEKINALQYNYFYEVDFSGRILHVEIESGINNGTVVNDYSWDTGTKPETRTVSVLKDIVLGAYEEGFLKNKAQAVLSANKDKLFAYHRANSYDNYVTGGNSKLELDPLLKQLKFEHIYEEQEVGLNLV